jgi:GxxExxY protein
MEARLREIASDIYSELGQGYSEAIYHCAFEVALRDALIPYETETIIPVSFKGHNVGNVRSDIIVDKSFVLELKSVAKLTPAHTIQLVKYMTLLDIHDGLLINFGPNLEVVPYSTGVTAP